MQPPYASAASAEYGPPGDTRVRVGEALRFAFSGNFAANVGIATLLQFVPILGPVSLQGWLAEGHQRLAAGHREMPALAFGDVMNYFLRGLPAFVARFVAALPLSLVVGGVMGLVGVVAAALSAATRDPTVVLVVLVLGSVVTLLATVATIPLTDAWTTVAERTESWDDTFAIGKVFRYTRETYWVSLVKSFVFSLVALALALGGLLLCFVGIYAAVVVLQIAGMHLRWQVHARQQTLGGLTFPAKALTPLASELGGAR